MPRGHPQTLKVPTSEEARLNGSKGGKASARSRREKANLRKCLEILLETEMKDKSGKTLSGAEALSAKLFQAALKGDIRAFEVLRDTAGQKPVEKVMTATVEPDVIEEVEQMVHGTNKD